MAATAAWALLSLVVLAVLLRGAGCYRERSRMSQPASPGRAVHPDHGQLVRDRAGDRGAVRVTGLARVRQHAQPRGPRRAAARPRGRSRAGGSTTPALDVTSDDSVAAATADVLRETGGRLDVLINNAGYYQFGALEETSPDELRAQLETNVVGVQRVTRAVLPAMRARRRARSSPSGRCRGASRSRSAGPYHASKWALEGMIEALRLELIPFGVRVVLIEPGPYHTMLHDNERLAAAGGGADSPYAALLAAYRRQIGQAAAPGRPRPLDRRDRARRHEREPPIALAGGADVADGRPAARVRP